MSTDSNTTGRRKLKVKFVGRFNNYLQCRKTKVHIATKASHVESHIKHLQDSIRDLENILEVLEQVDLKAERPSVGQLMYLSMPDQYEGHDRKPWSELGGGQVRWQKWGEAFINALQEELYLTEKLERGESDDYLTYKRDASKAVQEILERR